MAEQPPAVMLEKDLYPFIHFLTFCDHFLSVPLPLALKQYKLRHPAKWEAYTMIKETKPTDEEVDKRSNKLKEYEDEAREELKRESLKKVAVWNEESLGDLEAEWWKVAKECVVKVLGEFGLELIAVESNFSFHIQNQSTRQSLTIEELSTFLEKAEQRLLRPNLFSYSTLVSSLVSSITSLLSDSFPEIFPSSLLLSSIYSKPTTPFGEEWSAMYDIAFEGGGDHGNLVAYPDANNFNSFLIDYWHKLAVSPNRIYVDFFSRCVRAISHEIVHCLQSKLKQIDNNPQSWSAEHDASYLSGSLLYAATKQTKVNGHSLDELLFQGWYEWMMLTWQDEVSHQKAMFDGYVGREYEKWKDSFGLTPPANDVTQIRTGTGYYFKNVIAFEALNISPQLMQVQIKACFQNRTGDVYSASVVGLQEAVSSCYELGNKWRKNYKALYN